MKIEDEFKSYKDKLMESVENGEVRVDNALTKLVDSKYTLPIILIVCLIVIYLAFS
jgi:hypothetical protein